MFSKLLKRRLSAAELDKQEFLDSSKLGCPDVDEVIVLAANTNDLCSLATGEEGLVSGAESENDC
jgi:hypothetical protein